MSLMKKIKVDHNQQYLVYEDNTPFFYLADTAWCAPQGCKKSTAKIIKPFHVEKTAAEFVSVAVFLHYLQFWFRSFNQIRSLYMS